MYLVREGNKHETIYHTHAVFALKVLMVKYREDQKELCFVFVDLEKSYNRVPREEM